MAATRTLGWLLPLALVGCVGRIEGGGGADDGPYVSGLGPGGPGAQPRGSVDTPNGPVSCDKPSVGVAPLSRITRAQYANTLLDLTGLELDLASLLPEDERLGSFSQNSVAAVSVNELSRYRDAAERVAASVADQRKDLWSCSAGAEGAACATELIRKLGETLQRAPLVDAERARYLALYDAQAAGSFERGMSAVLEAMLQSPYFLYRLELPPAVSSPGPRSLTSHELASRLSFLLWNSGPDSELLAKAAAGTLVSAEQLRSEAQRLLADPRAERAIATFHREWLGISELAQRPKDTALFPDYSATSAQQMQTDAERFAVDGMLRGDGTLASLLQLPFTAAVDGTSRAGLLMQPAFLAAHASADQTSIVLRGNFVRSSMLCDPPPPPPANADVQAPELGPNATLRERFAEHESDPTCASCHKLMDPIGFGFESYDAVGRYRTSEGGRPVDATGEIVGSRDADGKFNGAQELSRRLAASEQVRDCLARHWFTFAFGRGADTADACAFQGAYDAYLARGYDLRELLLAFVTSDAFRLKAEAP